MIKLLILVATFRLAESGAGDTHIVSVDKDFNKVHTNDELSNHVLEILDNLKTFKVPIHPRIRLFYLLLKRGMADFADMTSDTIFVPYKYNVLKGNEIKT